MDIDELFSDRVKTFDDWRGLAITKLRQIVNSAIPEATEVWKWDTLVWDQNGLVCAIGAFKDKVGLNFFKGASVADPHKLFNDGLEAKGSRRVSYFEGDAIDADKLKELVRSARDLNLKK